MGGCGKCHNAYYCSPVCQARDWSRHNAYCSRDVRDTGPDRKARLASQIGVQFPSIFFPEDNGDDDSDSYGDSAEWSIQDDSDEMKKIIELFASIPDIDVPPEDCKKAPNAMAVDLMPHQRVGLTWLMEQEDSARNGGILADTMGLGKTIQALSLILAHPSRDSAHKTTLIVAPLALLRQWEREIEEKIKPAYKLKTIIVHGQRKKSMTMAKLLSYDVVLTTYGTIAAEYNPRKGAKTKKLIMATRFHRIILDEAHNIKNDRSNAAQAVLSIRATYRLCMTGTPLMNNVKELYSLIRFLRISPYDGWKRFYQDFAKPLKGKKWEHSSAMKALQAFLRTILLQRTATSQIDGKQILNLPELISQTATTEFNEDQRDFYNHLEQKLALKFNKYLKAGTVLKNYSYILVLILRLRQCCCHPFLIMNHGIPEGTELKPEEMINLALKLDEVIVERLKAQTDFQCPICDQVTQNPVVLYPCGHQLCGECFTGLTLVRGADRCEDNEDEPPLPNCPSPTCRGVVDPRKVLCYCFFTEAHTPHDASDDGELVEEDLNDVEDISDYSDEADEDGNLRDFVVSDEDEGLSESNDDDAEDDGDDEPSDDIGVSLPQKKSRGKAASEGENDDEPEAENDKEDITTASREEISPQWYQDDKAGSDSDGSLPEIGVLWQRAGDQKQSNIMTTPRTGGLPIEPTTKRAPGSSAVKAKTEKNLKHSRSKSVKGESNGESGKTKRRRLYHANRPAAGVVKREEDDDISDDEASTASRKRKGHKGKGVAKSENAKAQPSEARSRKKKNRNFTSLADLKVESNKNAAAKQRYLRRLRKEYESSAKIDRTIELLKKIREECPNEKILIFSVFTSFLDLLEIPIQDQGCGYRRYDGAMSTSAREAAVDDFKVKPDVKIMLVSMMAGNAGLNLQEASHVIILDPFWNPSVEDQAVGRAHRLGQKKPVVVHKILIEGTVEDRIVDLQEGKRNLVGEVLNNEAARSMGRLSVNELASLFGIGTGGRSRPR